jgi:hypothetical protein
MLFFDNSRPDRRKRAYKYSPPTFEASPIPPAKTYELLTFDDLFNGQERELIFDVESYINYFLVSFKCIASGKVIFFEDAEDRVVNTQLLSYIMYRYKLIGFNSRTYDLPILLIALQGVRAAKLKEISNEIIKGDMQAYEVERKYGVRAPHINHIDLIEVAPITASLKIYAGRLHCERMQDLPFPEDAVLTFDQAMIVRDYNINDLDNTLLLYNHLKESIELREELGREYNQDLRSKSDAQIAEAVIVSELEKLGVSADKPKYDVGYEFYYQVPDFIEFQTPQFRHALDVVRSTPFIVGNSGAATCPEAISALLPTLDGKTYVLGVGGLHSTEKSAAHRADETTLLIDRDVASFYPQIILNLSLYPDHLGEGFLKVYKSIVDRRLTAKFKSSECKKKGDKEGARYWKAVSDSLKIVINGTFGKLGNFYSKLYAPHLLTQVTVTGQLSLMMLIEMVVMAGFEVISANTDGIVIKCPKHLYKELEAVVIIWEEKTGFLTEETRYRGLLSRDVNNYYAFTEDGEVKTKGVYSEVGSALNSPLSKNPESYICSLAVQEFIGKGIPINETIFNGGVNCETKHYPTIISRFVNVRTVKGGAAKDGIYLGKAIRWYYSKAVKGTIQYILSGNNVPRSEGAQPLMIMPSEGLPPDLDYDHYINEANDILYDIGYYVRPAKQKLI